MTSTFLFCGLLFPRLTLLYCYLYGGMPHNTTPYEIDVLGAVLAPRVLIAVWCWENDEPGWTVAFIAVWLLLSVSAPSRVPSSRRRQS